MYARSLLAQTSRNLPNKHRRSARNAKYCECNSRMNSYSRLIFSGFSFQINSLPQFPQPALRFGNAHILHYCLQKSGMKNISPAETALLWQQTESETAVAAARTCFPFFSACEANSPIHVSMIRHALSRWSDLQHHLVVACLSHTFSGHFTIEFQGAISHLSFTGM